MYSEELEEIIEAALADGELSEKERAVLHKRAMAEGVDLDELDIIIDGRLAKAKKEQENAALLQAAQQPSPTYVRYGNVLKCPSCGAQVLGGSAVCSECGYAFSNVNGNRSIEMLQKRLDEYNRRQEKRSDGRSLLGGLAKSIDRAYGLDGTIKGKMDIISTFPVPNTRADLLDFLAMIQEMAKSTGPKNGQNMSQEEDLSYAYWVLYNNCINRAKMSFANDKDFAPYIAYHEKQVQSTKGFIGYLRCNPKMRFLFFLILFYVVLLIICVIAVNTSSIPSSLQDLFTSFYHNS